jgi:hypothetical protein
MIGCGTGFGRWAELSRFAQPGPASNETSRLCVDVETPRGFATVSVLAPACSRSAKFLSGFHSLLLLYAAALEIFGRSRSIRSSWLWQPGAQSKWNR